MILVILMVTRDVIDWDSFTADAFELYGNIWIIFTVIDVRARIEEYTSTTVSWYKFGGFLRKSPIHD